MKNNQPIMNCTIHAEFKEIPDDRVEEFISAIYGMSFENALSEIRHDILKNKKEDNEPSTKQTVIFTKPKRYKKACLK